MKSFKEWWNSPLKKSDPSLLSHRECAEQAWDTAYQLAFKNAQEFYTTVEEPPVDDAQQYVVTHNIEHDTFYVGTLTEIMEWCEEWNHPINTLSFYRLGDEIRVGFVDLGKETRFSGGKK